MFDRMSMMIGAGVVTAGVSAAMLAGAGVAIAAPDPSAGGETSTSDASASERTRSEPDASGPETPTATRDEDPDETADTDTEDAADTADDNDAAEPAPDADVTDATDEAATAPEGDDTEPAPTTDATDNADDADNTDNADNTADAGRAAANDAADEPAVEPSVPATPSADSEDAVAAVEPAGRTEPDLVVAASTPQESASAPVVEAVPALARLSLVSATETPTARAAAPRQTLLSLVGTVIFDLYSFAIRVLGGPPLLPWGSTVTVRSSKVAIDCGDGYEVPVDWYVPEGTTPTRLIYLQHGFLAAGPFYSYTASRLAEATHSIVVTTSLTSNFLACDGCWVGGSPMHKAVADLFGDGNTALADSAEAAGYGAALLSGVDKVVLMGHSAGGGLAAGTAGYMAENGTIGRLAGVVMLDGVGFGSVLPDALEKLPDDVPLYNLSGKSYFWNLSGASNTALEAARPGDFYGVRLVGGLHSDTMAGGNIFVQTGLYLVTGFSKPQNVKAAEILSAAWANDMFDGTAPVDGPLPASPYYGSPGDLLQIETPRGTAEAYVSPGPEERLTLIDVLFGYFGNIVFGIDFATCREDSDAELAKIIPISASDTLLSLDGKAKPGQSIAQHVCMG